MAVALPIIDAFDKTRKIANKPFRAICYAPFNSMFLDTKGHVRACCVNTRYLLGDIKKQRLDDIWFGDKARRLREAMNNYDLRLGCEFCEWQLGDGNFAQEESHYSSLHSLKYDGYPLLPMEGKEGWWPSNLEFNLSNTCNLECVMCDGFFSSSIRARREKQPPIPRAYKDEFFQDLRKYIPHVRTAQFLGGEPFLINEHFRVWDMMIEDKKIEVCYITTNGTIYNSRVERVLNSLPCAITMSMDGVTPETFEKIRVNAKYDVFMDNFRKFSDYLQAKKWKVGLNFTLSRLNWHEFPEMCLFAERENALVAICTMAEPKHLSIYTLSAEELEPIVEAYEKRDAEMNRVLKNNLTSWRNALEHLRNRLENARKEGSMPSRLGVITDGQPSDITVAVEELIASVPDSTETQEGQTPSSVSHLSSESNGHAQDKNGQTCSELKHAPSASVRRKMDDFRKSASLSAELQALEERLAFDRLSSWSSSPISTARLDNTDRLITVTGPGDSFLGLMGDFLNKQVDEIHPALVAEFGPVAEGVELEATSHRRDSLVLLGEDVMTRTYLRVITLPRYDEQGTLAGVLLLASTKTPTR